MLSIVVSTRKIVSSFIDQIKATIGIKDYQLIIIENNNEKSLTKVYNEGLDQAKYDHVVFCHDDLIFNTKNWGKKILNDFEKNPEYGIIGVAGSTLLPQSGTWWEDRSKLVGRVKHKNQGKTYESKYSAIFPNQIAEVCLVDGLFFAVNKNKIKERFDENIPGFHFYDIDFCISNHLKGIKIGVSFSIELTHLSIGQTSSQWEENKNIFLTKHLLNPSTGNLLLPYEITPTMFNLDQKQFSFKTNPKVSIIIPHKENNDLIKNLLQSIKDQVKYENYNIIIADTGSSTEKLKELKTLAKKYKNVKIIEYQYYHFAKINNDIVKNYCEDTELVVFCNNDIVMINDVISQLVYTYLKNKSTVGTIGVRLHYQDGKVQHSGMLLYSMINTKQNNATQLFLTHYGLKSSYTYYTEQNKNVPGNTAALMLISKELFEKAGMFPEHYNECFEDVELNLKLLTLGKENIFEPNAVAYHLESQTRNLDTEKDVRQQQDYEVLTGFIKNNLPKIKKTMKIFQF